MENINRFFYTGLYVDKFLSGIPGVSFLTIEPERMVRRITIYEMEEIWIAREKRKKERGEK